MVAGWSLNGPCVVAVWSLYGCKVVTLLLLFGHCMYGHFVVILELSPAGSHMCCHCIFTVWSRFDPHFGHCQRGCQDVVTMWLHFS